VGLGWGPLSLVCTIEELLGRKSSCSGLENQGYGHRDLSRCPCDTLFLQKLALTLLTNGGGSVCVVPSQTEAMEFVCFLFVCTNEMVTILFYCFYLVFNISCNIVIVFAFVAGRKHSFLPQYTSLYIVE
jgi:hypothetical protein